MKIVTFSGIDGAGKSTQIHALESWLKATGQRTRLLTFWDDVVAFPTFRESLSLKAFKGDKGVGSPDKPLVRRDKNVTSRPVTMLRFCLYLADALNLCRKVYALRRREIDVVIFDRYIYDELANLPIHRRLARWFIRIVLGIVPRPDVAYIIDADPDAAFARKPEYPLDFLRKNRQAYLTFTRLAGNIVVIEPLSIEAGALRVREAFTRRLTGAEASFSQLPALQ